MIVLNIPMSFIDIGLFVFYVSVFCYLRKRDRDFARRCRKHALSNDREFLDLYKTYVNLMRVGYEQHLKDVSNGNK